MKKRITKLLFLTIILTVLLSTFVFAYAKELTYQLGNNVFGTFDTEKKTLTISGTGDMYNFDLNTNISPIKNNSTLQVEKVIIENGVTSIGNCSLSGFYKLEEIIIPNSVKSIGESAFKGCYKITSITIPSSVRTLGKSAFADCSNLIEITLPNSLTSIGEYTFSDCSNLKEIVIPNSVITIGDYAFENCEKLDSIAIPNLVKSIGDYAFNNCNLLENVVIGDSVESIGVGAFQGCKSLRTVKISKSVTTIGEKALQNCEKLISVVVNPLNPVFASKDGVLFNKDLTELLFFPMAKYEEFEYYTIPDTVVSIEDYAFDSNHELRELTIPASVTNISKNALYNCYNMEKITVDPLNPSYASIDGVLYSKDLTKLILCPNNEESFVIPNTVTNIEDYAFIISRNLQEVVIPNSVTSIGVGAFQGCNDLQKINIPDSVISIGDYAFESCYYLISVIIPESVTSIGQGVFRYCNNLTDIIFDESNPSFTYENKVLFNKDKTELITILFTKKDMITSYEVPNTVTAIRDGAFSGYYDYLEEVIIPDSVVSIGDYAFETCGSLKRITIPKSVTHIGVNAFNNCYELEMAIDPDNTSFTYDDKVLFNKDKTELIAFLNYENGFLSYTIPNTVTTIRDYAFKNCNSLASLTIPATVTSIGKDIFDDCNNLHEINIDPSNPCFTSVDGVLFSNDLEELIAFTSNKAETVTTYEIPNSVKIIRDYAFANYNDLKEVIIPDSVVSIGEQAFEGCRDLRTISIPKSVTHIGKNAFTGCTYLYEFIVDPDNTVYGSILGVLTSKDLTSLIFSPKGSEDGQSYKIPDTVVTIGDYAFKNSSNLYKLIMPDSVVNIGDGAFEGCYNMSSLTLSNSLSNIGKNSLTFDNPIDEVIINETDSSVVYIDGVLYNKDMTKLIMVIATDETRNMKTFEIPNTVTTIGDYAFNNCYGLETIIIPNSVTTIGDYAFNRCSKLTSITLPNSVTSIGNYVFNGCGNLQKINLSDSLVSIGDYAFSSRKITEITLPDTLKHIGKGAFSWSEITSIEIPSSVEVINESTFAGSKIESIKMHNGITTIKENAFNYCNKLTSIEIPNSVTTIENRLFSDCSGLTSITIPSSVTTIGDEAFNNCINLTSITIPESVKSFGENVFAYCKSLTEINVEEKNPCFASFDGVLFNKNLTELIIYPIAKSNTYVIPDSVITIGNYAFASNNNLESVSMPDSVITIGDNAFYNTSKLPEIIIGNSVETIGDNAFDSCYGLTSIVIPNSVETIKSDAFYSCSRLAHITNYGENQLIYASAFEYCGSYVSGSKTANAVITNPQFVYFMETLDYKVTYDEITNLELVTDGKIVTDYNVLKSLDDLDLTNLYIDAHYTLDGRVARIKVTHSMIKGVENLGEGNYVVYIEYGDKTCNLSLKISQYRGETLNSLKPDLIYEINNGKSTYLKGERLDVADYSFRMKFAEGENPCEDGKDTLTFKQYAEHLNISVNKLIDSYISGFDSNSYGKKSITIPEVDNFNLFEVFNIDAIANNVIPAEVYVRKVIKLELENSPEQTYEKNQVVDFSKNRLKLTLDNNEVVYRDISNATIRYSTSVVGKSQIKLEAYDAIGTYDITVNDSNSNPSTPDEPYEPEQTQPNETKPIEAKNNIVFRKVSGYINGYEDNTFRPDNYITRAEIANIISNIIDGTSISNLQLNDIQGAWYTSSIQKLLSLGVMQGVGNSKFKPNDYITRQDLAIVLTNLINKDKSFGDIKLELKDIENAYGKESIEILVSLGVIKGYEDNTFRPNNYVTKAEAIVLINNLFRDYIEINTNKNVNLTDISNHWAEEAIRNAYIER